LTIPNVVSFLRIAAIPLFIYFLLIPGPENRIIAAAVYLVLVLSDALDGYLARKLNAISAFGKYIDPLADKILVIAALIGLVELKVISSIPVMVIIAREFTVTAFRLAAANRNIVVAASWLGKWKTVIQMTAVFLLILRLPYGVVALWIAAVVTVISGVDYIYKSWQKVF
jgi:CDP-diacylglycerol--glycerol-3-phosphate 3-phosphatidyltransferase